MDISHLAPREDQPFDPTPPNLNALSLCLKSLSYLIDQHLIPTMEFDIFLLHSSVTRVMMGHVHDYLSGAGYRVYYPHQRDEEGGELHEDHLRGLASCKVVVACIERTFQEEDRCVDMLYEANKYRRPVVCLAAEPDPRGWASDDLKFTCTLDRAKTVDVSDMAAIIAEIALSDETADPALPEETLACLHASLAPLERLLIQAGVNLKQTDEVSDVLTCWTCLCGSDTLIQSLIYR